MNILFCQTTLQRTGSEKSLFSITKAIKAGDDDRTYVLAGADGPMREAIEQTVDGVTIVDAPPLQKRLSLVPRFIKSFWTVFTAVRRLKRRQQIDVVYVNTLMFPQALIAARLNGLPCVVHVRETATRYPSAHYYTYLMLATLLARRVVCAARYILGQGGVLFPDMLDRKAAVVYNSSDLRREPTQRAVGDIAQILILGGVAPLKGTGDLPSFATELRKRLGNNNFKIEVIGLIQDTQLYKTVTAALTAEALDEHVLILGDQADVVPCYERAHILVHLSHSETFSRALVEAANMSLPAVTTNVGGSPEAVIDGVSGFVVQVQNTSAMAERVARLIEDAELYRNMAAHAFARYQSEFTPEQMISRIRPVVADAAGDPEWARGHSGNA